MLLSFAENSFFPLVLVEERMAQSLSPSDGFASCKASFKRETIAKVPPAVTFFITLVTASSLRKAAQAIARVFCAIQKFKLEDI